MKLVVNGVSYHIEIVGQGEPLLLLHGFTGSDNTWSQLLNDWQSRFQCIAIDFLGHGESAIPSNSERYNMDQTINDLLAILDHLQIRKTHLLGYSMGGRVALGLAVAAPDRISKLVLESSSPGLRTEKERQDRIIQDTKLANFIRENGVEAFVDKWENIPLFDSQKKLDTRTQNRIRQERLANQAIGLANSLKGMGAGVQPSLWEELSFLQNSTLLVAGELDKKFCRILEMMANQMVNSQFLIVNNAGHAIHVEQSRIFGKIVSEFLIRKEE